MIAADRIFVSFMVAATASVTAVAVATVQGPPPRASEPVDSAATLALATWSRSCAAPVDGLCVTTRAATPAADSATQPFRCGPDSDPAIVVEARSAHEAAAARVALREVIAQFERSGGDRHAYVMAKVALADDALERYLELASPTGLNFDPANKAVQDESRARFAAWVNAKVESGNQVRAQYEAISVIGDPVGALIATSRMGTLSDGFATSLLTTEIPTSVRTGELADEKVSAFCDAMTSVAEPLENAATQAFSSCVSRARVLAHGAVAHELHDIVDAAQPCLDALATSSPDEHPALEELFTAPDATRMYMVLGIVEPSPSTPDYQRENTRGVALRIAHDFTRARAAYEHALAIDPSRPEAHFNLGLLEVFESNRADDLAAALDHYARAAQFFAEASARATGELRTTAMNHMEDAQKTVRQIRGFLAEQPL